MPEIPVPHGPDVSERHVDRHPRRSRLSFDTTQRDDCLARCDELFGDEVNVESSIEARQKSFENVFEPFEMTAADRHARGYVVDHVWCLQTSQRLPMARSGRFVESSHTLFVFLSHHF